MSVISNGYAIYNILIKTPGATRAAVCGVLGNIQQENSMSPTDNSGGLGIIQWTGSRRRAVIRWCRSSGYNYQSITGQAKYLSYDLQTSYKGMWATMCSYPNTQAGAVSACDYFEKKYEHAGKPMLYKRKQYAREWWNRTANGVPQGNTAWTDSESSYNANIKDLVYYAEQEVGHKGGYKYAKSGAQWCQYFATWCAEQAGVAGTAAPTRSECSGSTSLCMQWFQEKGRFGYMGSYTPQRNDFVYYKTGASHVGIVVDFDGTTLHTIEGNYSKKVTARTITKSIGKDPGWYNITGFGRIHDFIQNADGGGTSEDGTTESKEITNVTRIEDVNTRGKWVNANIGHPAYKTNGVELTIANNRYYAPEVLEGIQLEQSRVGSPSKLTFTVLKDSNISFVEGNPVTLRYNGYGIFSGYIFSKERSDNEQIQVTAYDQIRYLKSKDTMAYSGVTATGLLKQIAAEYQLTLGECEETGLTLPNAVKESTLLDMIDDALDQTVLDTGRFYVLWDDYGKLRLTNIQSMTTNLLIDETQAEKFSYTSSIDDETYTRVEIAWDDKTAGTRYVRALNNTEKQSDWGVLTYYEKLNDSADQATIEAKAQVLLDYYGKQKRTLSYEGVFGNAKIHAGCSVIVKQTIGDVIISNYMVCENVTHHFKADRYTMDLKLSGIRGEFRV